MTENVLRDDDKNTRLKKLAKFMQSRLNRQMAILVGLLVSRKRSVYNRPLEGQLR